MRSNSHDRRNKPVDEHLRVHAWTSEGFKSAGVLSLDEEGDRGMSAVFEYDPSYVVDPCAFPLDPLNMPLGRQSYATTSQFVMLGSIFDSAPDAWGRKVARSSLDNDEQNNMFRNAFLKGADGIGALVLTPLHMNDEASLTRIVAESIQERPRLSQLERAAKAAHDLEKTGHVGDDLEEMLSGSWTIGGARPKAILQDDSKGGQPLGSVIAKFPSFKDHIDRGRLEFASLEMAADMGFSVPAHSLIDSSTDKKQSILILDRFDRDIVEERVLRRHYVSAMSMISYQPQHQMLSSRFDQAMLSWNKLLEVTSRISENPIKDRVEMYARLALNAALHNTDGHLKNFGFLKSRQDPFHYEIAPVFDVSPQAGDRHYMYCGSLGQWYTLKDVVSQARSMGIALGAAQEIEEKIMSVVDRRHHYFDEAGMTASDQEKANGWVEKGLGYGLAHPKKSTSKMRP